MWTREIFLNEQNLQLEYRIKNCLYVVICWPPSPLPITHFFIKNIFAIKIKIPTKVLPLELQKPPSTLSFPPPFNVHKAAEVWEWLLLTQRRKICGERWKKANGKSIISLFLIRIAWRWRYDMPNIYSTSKGDSRTQ